MRTKSKKKIKGTGTNFQNSYLSPIYYFVLLIFFTLTCCSSPPEKDLRDAAPLSFPLWPGIHVIVVSFDALRADALGVYGYTPGISPMIDRFARECVVFEQAYTAAPVTPTSFAAAFTGMLPTKVFRGWRLKAHQTLAGAFSDAGYKTAAFVNNVQLSPRRGFNRGFQSYRFDTSAGDIDMLNDMTAWLEKNRDHKIFTWIHFINPHAPYAYRKQASHFYDPSYDGKFQRTTNVLFDTDDPVDIARIRSLYDGEVFYADFLFGRLVQALRALGLADQALVVLTSDHGEEFKDHGGFQHGRLYEEHIRIPLLIHHPAMRKTERISTLVSNMDLLPTLLHAAGIKRNWEVDGRDLLEPEQKPGAVVSLAMTGEKHRAAALRFEGHKLIVDLSPLYRETLFDLEADPRETLNIAPNHPERVSTGLRALRRAVGEEAWTLLAETGLTGDPRAGLDSDSIEALRELGYVTE